MSKNLEIWYTIFIEIISNITKLKYEDREKIQKGKIIQKNCKIIKK